MTEYYRAKLQAGLEFQDYVTNRLLDVLGVPLSTYQSKEWQKKGENRQGIEIKFDDKFEETGNLYIETAEKTHPDNAVFIPSGIRRADNAWLYIIGNYKTLYIFGKSFLSQLWRTGKYPEVGNATSRGFLLNQEAAEKYCIKKIEEAGKKKPRPVDQAPTGIAASA